MHHRRPLNERKSTGHLFTRQGTPNRPRDERDVDMLSPCAAKRGTIPHTMGGLQFARNRTFEVARVVEIADDKEREFRELKVKIAALEANAVKSKREVVMFEGSDGGVRWRGVWWNEVWWRGCNGSGVGVLGWGLEPGGLRALGWPWRRSWEEGVLERTLGRRLGDVLGRRLEVP